VRLPLPEARPEDEQRHHHDAAADAEQAGEDAAAEPDPEQLRLDAEHAETRALHRRRAYLRGAAGPTRGAGEAR
jgi:hypothetical protein